MALCFTKAQNLVPNYSFENIIQCPQNCNQFINYVADWMGQGVGEGLCYFTAQCPGDTGSGGDPSSLSGNVPYNYDYGFQYAHTGVSYAEIITFISGSTVDTTYPYGKTVFANVRSYLEALLTDTLKSGVTYYVTFFVSLQNSCDFACNDIGAFFSPSYIVPNNSIFPSGPVWHYSPQIANNSKKQELTDTLNWMKISGSFVAKGGEKYIAIGNFKNDSLSSIRFIGQVTTNGTEAWYYIDDVIVSADSNYADSLFPNSVSSITMPQNETKVYPNPSNGKFTIEITNYESGIANQNNEIEIYNMMGQRIYSEALRPTSFRGRQAQGDIQIDLSNQPAGIYLYRIVSEKGEAIGTGKLIIQ